MDIFYIIVAVLLSIAVTLQAPVDEIYDGKISSGNLHGANPAGYLIEYRATSGHRLAKRDADSPYFDYSDDTDDNDDETLNSAADTYYVPYIRYRRYYGQRRRIYPNRRYDNYPALVGYADNRDRFPTVA